MTNKIPLPKSLLELPDKDRDAIVMVLLEASGLPKEKVLPHRTSGDEHNMWERNGDPLLADEEDSLYRELLDAEARNLAKLYVELGLPTDNLDIAKAFEPSYLAFEDELIKGKDSGRRRMTTYIKEMADRTKAQRQKFTEWVNDGKAFTRTQLSQIDKVISSGLPNFARKAEDYITRSAFIGKLRGQAEKENFETLGAYIDRYPTTIASAQKTSVVLTLREKQKAESKRRKVTILPLTPREAEAVKHASLHTGDKLTEVSDRHKAGIRQLVIQAKRERWSAQKLAQELFDKFGDHNRDWRRVAITELAFATNDAYLSGCEEGDTLVGMGAEGACKHCKQYVIGKQVKVTHKPPTKDTFEGDMKQVWVGKSNYGRPGH